MALNDSAFAQALKSIFDAMDGAAAGAPKDNAWYAAELAKAINEEIKKADVLPGSLSNSAGSVLGKGELL